jgi:hypothetical protein
VQQFDAAIAIEGHQAFRHQKPMKRVTAFLAVWAVLFGVTFLVRRLQADNADPHSRSSEDEAQSLALKADLDLQPLRSSNVVEAATVSPQLDAAIGSFVREHSSGLRNCRNQVMKRSARPTEYLDISFVPVSEPADSPTGTELRLSAPVLERSTLSLTDAETSCVLTEFKKIVVNVPISSSGNQPRTLYHMCFRGLKNNEKKEN